MSQILTILLFGVIFNGPIITSDEVNSEEPSHFVLAHFNYNYTADRYGGGLSYWYFGDQKGPLDFTEIIGIDVGTLYDDDTLELYADVQTGLVFIGVSAGFFWEHRVDRSDQWGMQYALWLNYVVGGYVKLKHYIPENQFAREIGLYITIPFVIYNWGME